MYAIQNPRLSWIPLHGAILNRKLKRNNGIGETEIFDFEKPKNTLFEEGIME